jgi:hypothetical protein
MSNQIITIDTKKWNTQWTRKILRLSESSRSYQETYFWNLPFFQENIWEIRLLNGYNYPRMEITFDICHRERNEYTFHVEGDTAIRPNVKSFSSILATFKIDNRPIDLFPCKFRTYIVDATIGISTVTYKIVHGINTPFINGESISIRHPKFYFDDVVVYDSAVNFASVDIPLTTNRVVNLAELTDVEIYIPARDLSFVLELIHKKV